MTEAGVVCRCAGCGKPIGSEFIYCDACTSYRDSGKGGYYRPLAVRRRYAKAKSAFEVGVWHAKSMDLLLGIMVGSMPDVKNSYVELVRDGRNLRIELKRMGLKYEDCFCGELSPESHAFMKRDGTPGVTVGELWHEHGFMRFDEFIKAGDLHSVLSPLWGKIHGSQVVDVKVLTDVARVIKYNVKDAVKNYLSDEHCRKHLLKSRGWLPAGYREVDRVLSRWALAHRDDSWDGVGEEPLCEYVADVWAVKREYLRLWCGGETLHLNFGSYRVVVMGDKIHKF